MATVRRGVDEDLWKACAGNSVRIPAVDSLVYYFPEGHAEQSHTLVEFPPQHPTSVFCRIKYVKYLAHYESDEVFAELRLEPISSPPVGPFRPESDGGDETEIVSCAKTLTLSDANNGGGFSVPRSCADLIFPPLDYQVDRPVQILTIQDVHGGAWQFRHIYRGEPRRHLLTTGWSKFVNHKKLVAGDSLVFVKNKIGEIFVGIRRTVRSSTGLLDSLDKAGARHEDGESKGFSRSSRGRVSAQSVLDATELAASGREFDVVYYPRAGSTDFVVLAHSVAHSLKVHWSVGVRIKMAMETEGSSRGNWIQGSVAAVTVPDESAGLVLALPWRMLQVDWDESEVLHDVKRVNPWQVDSVSTTLHVQDPCTATKKTRLSPQKISNEDTARLYPVVGASPYTMSTWIPTIFNNNISPAGMQGARHDTSLVASLTNSLSNENEFVSSDKVLNNSSGEMNPVCTKLCRGDLPPSETSCSQSQVSTDASGTEIDSNGNHAKGSFRLFGQTIYTANGYENDDSKDKSCKKI